MRDARDRTTRPPRPGRGFTLTELLVVIAIIGILVTFILIAAQDGIRRAEEKATQSLIAKLDVGVAERIEAILLRRADTSLGHHGLAAVTNASFPAIVSGDPNFTLVSAIGGLLGSTNCIISPQRAQVIAQFDLVRAELPDVFFVQSTIDATYGPNYPVNFAGGNFQVGGVDNYLIPLGAYSSGAPGTPTTGAAPGDPNQAIGIFGATWQAAAGIYKNLGYLPQGYDGADNDSDGLIDEFDEGYGKTKSLANGPTVSDPDNPSGTVTLKDLINRRLAAHKHNTARSEMLYALLVEGVGPMGSTFSRDEFTDRQVRDTDGDGLPEFIDAWGQPLQFFRWPIFYNNLSSTSLTPGAIGYVAKGTDAYSGPSEPRQVDPLDPNQTLVSLVWWADPPNGGTGSGGISASAATFQNLYHSLTDPNAAAATAAQKTAGVLWDRGGSYARRAYYSRFLILSGGPDQALGVNVPPAFPSGATTIALGVTYLTGTENPAAASDLIAAGDDISNQGLAAPGGGVR